MMASKFLHDEGEEESVLNDEWATSAHMSVEELNELERNFLMALVCTDRVSYFTAVVADVDVVVVVASLRMMALMAGC